MIGKLFRTGNGASAAPDGETIYAVGDIHGCASLLDLLMTQIEADAAGGRRRLVFLGDYVDRGPDSKGVIDRLIGIKAARPETVFLKGNHEQAMLDFLGDPNRAEEWLHWGGDKTLQSYGIDEIWTKHPERLARELEKKVAGAHLEFLHALGLWTIAGDYAFVHAGFRPGVAIEEQTAEDCLWIRADFHNAEAAKRPPKTVVHGHHPVKRPLDAGWRIDVDTGAVWSDALTAVVLEGTARRFISTGKS